MSKFNGAPSSWAQRKMLLGAGTIAYRNAQRQLHEELKRVDLPTLMREYGITLERYGPTRQRGLCPFHHEQTPSFIVYEDAHYHCFGCGVHGDAITFLRRYAGLSFSAACKKLHIGGR